MKTLATVAVLGAVSGLGQAAKADEAAAQATYRDIQQTLGSVPGFFKAFPEAGIAGAWAEFKAVQLGKTRLDGKTKELIGLGIAAQIPCHYCVYFHTAAARANGATDQEISEAVAMAAIVRHWSAVLNGMQVDPATFKSEVDTVLRAGAEKAKTAGMAK
jgi:AhpD family alkylhydroperoxidase